MNAAEKSGVALMVSAVLAIIFGINAVTYSLTSGWLCASSFGHRITS